MTASPASLSAAVMRRVPLRIRLRDSATSGSIDGVWWPQSRSLQVEAADLVDHFPRLAGRISRLLFSRPDWDDAVVAGRGARHIHAHRGQVKVGSFPHDDTHTMVLILSTGQRLNLHVVPSATDAGEADRALQRVVCSTPVDPGRDLGWTHWEETPPT